MTDNTRAIGRRSSEKNENLQTSYRKHWGFVIGIDDYGTPDHRPLKNAVNDAQEFANLLRFYNYDIHEIYNEKTTKSDILGHLRDTLPSLDVREDDAVVIFFAGHGASQEGKRGYIVPHGASQSLADYISMGELTEVCETLHARHILIILDCCFSGMAATRGDASAINRDVERNEHFLNDMLSKPAWQIIMAGEADTPVADSGRNSNHSVFTYHLLQGLTGAADAQGDRIVTGRELEQHLYVEVYAETKNSANIQIPFMEYINSHEAHGDFVFQIPENIPHPWVEDIQPPPPHIESDPEIEVDTETSASIEDRLTKIPMMYWGAGIALIVILIGMFAFRNYSNSPTATPPPEIMTGEFNVAVAQFKVGGEPKSAAIGEQSAEIAFETMQTELNTLAQNVSNFEVWGPSQVGTVEGFTREQRARAAEQLANEIGADVVVYTFLDFTTSPAMMSIEFAMPDSSLTDAAEIAGEYRFGEPVVLAGDGSTSTRIDIVAKLNDRVDLLSTLIIGVSHSRAGNYDKALGFFRQLEEKPEWNTVQGKEVLYLLIGNTLGKLDEVDQAEIAYKKAIELKPSYARGYVGLGSVSYIRALNSARTADDPSQIDFNQLDQALLEQSIQSYQFATTVPDQPILANVKETSQFGQGQAYLLQSISTNNKDFSNAIGAFESVVQAYADGEKPSLRELAGEAHARLGLIYVQSGSTELAIEAYTKATELLFDKPDRQQEFNREIRKLSNESEA